MDQESPRYRIALSDFRRARRKAALKEIVGWLTGKSNELLSFEEARQQLKAVGEEARGLHHIPLDAIIGSVGRYSDFTRDFLPRSSAQAGRWATVKSVLRDLDEMPPIQVYQIGEAYFVLDGNHRVSIARQRKATHIQAYITEIHTKVPLSSDTNLNDFILKAEYAEFIEHTAFDEACPLENLSITAPGHYKTLEKHISLHRQTMQENSDSVISSKEATASWFHEVYQPAVDIIQNRGILRSFPNRTETDLYVWIAQHQEALQKTLGWTVDPSVAATDFSDLRGGGLKQIFSRMRQKIYGAITPDFLETGPEPGAWRERQLATHDLDHLFTHILVPLSGDENSWQGLEQAIRIGWREESQLLGLHIIANEEQRSHDSVEAVSAQFKERCLASGLPGEMAIEIGSIASTIIQRARWSDLVILHLAHPPEPQFSARITSGLRTIIQRCPRPVLVVPNVSERFENLLLAYDGSPKSDEALYVAAYLAGRWEVPLSIIVIDEPGKYSLKVIPRARWYLNSRNIPAQFIQKEGSASIAIIEAAKENNSDMILMGGYSKKPVAEVVLGSTLNHVLRAAHQPVFICR
ncbi:MAG: universal stress protein [Chloroflexi bacterium]|nr:universal stress protein [Chloroflexota bacterium]